MEESRNTAVIDAVFLDPSIQGFWGDLILTLQDMRTCALGGAMSCYLGEQVKSGVVFWLRRNGFRLSEGGNVVFFT